MRKIFWILFAAFSFSFVACSEETEVGEFEGNWEERNAAYIDSIATVARANQGEVSGKWRVLPSFHLNDYSSSDNQEYAFAKILQVGQGTESPLYTDSVSVSYRGRLIPTVSYPEGYMFDQNYYGDLVTINKDGTISLDEENARIMVPSTFTVNGVVEGWSTALMKMHVGDIWRLYIPQSMAYGSSTSNSSIPAYSTLVFDVYLREINPKE